MSGHPPCVLRAAACNVETSCRAVTSEAPIHNSLVITYVATILRWASYSHPEIRHFASKQVITNRNLRFEASLMMAFSIPIYPILDDLGGEFWMVPYHEP